MWKKILLIGCLLWGMASCSQDPTEDLATSFENPPDQYKPWLYWYWIDENISREGITKDLEAMSRVGIGRALIGHVSPGGQRGSVKILSEPWWDLVEYAVSEGQRLGVDIGFFNGPGWSQSGGPWIEPDQSMRHIVFRDTTVTGPAVIKKNITHPDPMFEQVALQAFPAPEEDPVHPELKVKHVIAHPDQPDIAKLFDGNDSTYFVFPESTRSGQDFTIDLTLENANIIRAIQVDFLPIPFKINVEIAAQLTNGKYYIIKSFVLDRRYINFEIGPMRYQPAVFSLSETKTSNIRFRISNLSSDPGGGLKEIALLPNAVVDQYIEKQLGKMYSDPLPPWEGYMWPEQDEASGDNIIDPGNITDLGPMVDDDGNLEWQVPEGKWVILQSGMVPTGATNVPVPPEATGFECDKFTAEAIEAHFQGFIGHFLEKVPAERRKSLKTIVIDSYEVGPQNWTNGFQDIFRETYGYDPLPWLPVFGGRIVGNADKSDRFLWDVRRLTADLIAEVYVKRLRELCHEQGLELWTENYGHWGFPAEFLQYGGNADLISGEFWYKNPFWDLGPLECRAASSAAHIYGKTQVFAEAFTAGFNFRQSPFLMKSRGDQMFCEGVNHMVQHVYIHQPYEDKIPGVTAWFGMSYQRHNTWFEQSRAWNDYLRRCHFMLQQGLPVSDVCYFIGEDAPKMTGIKEPGLPPGYDYDYINADVIMNRLSVENGYLSLPDGKKYALMVLPPETTMRPGVLQKVRELILAGANIYGPPPVQSPSLENYPAADDRVDQLSGEIWGDLAAAPPIGRTLGKGRVFYGVSLEEVLKSLEVEKDVIVDNPSIRWTHRRKEGVDIYFVSNQENTSQSIELSFRIMDRNPEFWDPANGSIRTLGYYQQSKDRTSLQLTLDPYGSGFIVLKDQVDKSFVQQVSIAEVGDIHKPFPEIIFSQQGELSLVTKTAASYEFTLSNGSTLNLNTSGIPEPLTLNRNWQVLFPDHWDTPGEVSFDQLISWPDHEHPGIQHFSGTARYTHEIMLTAPYLGPEQRIILDLGEVNIMAEVIVNGKNMGILWKKPYRVDITDAVREGRNEVHIDITNTWWNRLVGDEKYLEGFPGSDHNQPRTYVTHKAWNANDGLMRSGLNGPVTVFVEQQYAIPVHSRE